MSEFAPVPSRERNLTEVDHFNNYRDDEGNIPTWVKNEVRKNLIPAIKEGGIGNAVHEAEHPYAETGERDERGLPIMAPRWLGKFATEHALSGRKFYRHDVGMARGEVEIDEAQYDSRMLRPGVKKVFISAKASEADAPYHIAKKDHVADADALRVSEVVTDDEGNFVARRMQALLVKDIPLAAWVAMLKDPNNVFGKSITIENEASALSVMKAHRELEVPADELPEGVVSLVEVVIPYIDDPIDRLSVEKQLERFREDQSDLHKTAEFYAEDWLEFEVELANSLHKRKTTYEIERFIAVMQDEFNMDDLATIEARHLGNNSYFMDRTLATLLEKAKQYTLFSTAGLDTRDEALINQMSQKQFEQISTNIKLARIAAANGDREGALALRAQTDRQVAQQNLKGVGGGCPGEIEAMFGGSDTDPLNDADNKFDTRDESLTSTYEKKVGRIKKGKCRVEGCPTRPREVKLGGCNVCIERCQKIFDRGEDPTKNMPVQETHSKKQYGSLAARELVAH